MVFRNGKSPVRQKLNIENYEEKYDKRLEFHETLRDRHNSTSCRQDNPCWSKEQERHSPREQEFFRRRHLWTDESGDKGVRSPPNSKTSVTQSYQRSWNHNRSKTYPFDHRIALSEPGLEPFHIKTQKNDVTVRERGVQTTQETSAICMKKDSSQQTDCAIAVLDGELLQLSEYLMEALHRERKLKRKLCILQELLSVLVQTSEKSWMAQLNEDHLKSKVANLENQLFFCSQFSKNKCEKTSVGDGRSKGEISGESQRVTTEDIDDKIASERQLQNVQMSLSVSSDECELWKEEYEKLKTDWIELSNKHCELKNERSILQSKLQVVYQEQIFGSQNMQTGNLQEKD
ncbi:unnamed protein product [Ranitomeya imitator]|uniref:Uncharacterized protein n=1 Tax=Ranitomeya imitator TaxID=111125 RepID=A0ABN9M0C8_9NEOB|nr:unnamed protein product [Ranitomeya imitator]